ncbi:hypothetical protein [Marinobacter sp.]|jgi:predicted phosphatase|uniref:hypothetical protein n=1 Tax=Marinobacter sp. TaxID=50741 RepID=UPI000C97BF64|nr:hypothetical protein [Marinobacter sp.]MAK50943.1 hypothetical protein [Marinobacter sp.]|tara:strand:- start:2632 stop:3096 length:465 start_codon:yes stop_codon:yes gene_type:complete
MFDVWLDLDKTIWNCYSESEVWAKQLEFPFKVVDSQRINAANGFCEVHEGFDSFIRNPQSNIKSFNIITAGAKYHTFLEDQPSYSFLSLLGYLPYISNMVFKTKEFIKGDFLKQLNNPNIILIDDDDKQLDNARKNNVQVIDRKSFKTWKDINL